MQTILEKRLAGLTTRVDMLRAELGAANALTGIIARKAEPSDVRGFAADLRELAQLRKEELAAPLAMAIKTITCWPRRLAQHNSPSHLYES